MVQDSYIDFSEPIVKKLEGFADTLENIAYESEDWKVVVSLFLLYLESNLSQSNIYDYIFKTDESKTPKLNLQEEKKELFEKINTNVKKLENSPNDVNKKWDQVREHYDVIKETEDKLNGKINGHYDVIKETEDKLNGKINGHYERIKEMEEEYRLKIENEYNQIKTIEEERNQIVDGEYFTIKTIEEERNQIVDGEYFTIKTIESDIEDIHAETSKISEQNDNLYKEVEKIDHKLSDIENYIEDSEWKIELDSPEEKVFGVVKNNLILNKRLKYGDI